MHDRTIITIGRQFGSGGREIGKKLADQLGVPFYDKELLELAAEQSGISRDVIENYDEMPTNSLLYSLSMGNYGMGGGGPFTMPSSTPSRSCRPMGPASSWGAARTTR